MPHFNMCLGLLFVFPVAVRAESPKPTIAANVNGEELPLAKVDAFIKSNLAILPATEAQQRQLRSEVLADMIDDLVLKQFLNKNAPKVESAEIDRQLAAFTASLGRKGKTLAQFLQESKQTENELRDSWTTLLQLDGYFRKNTTDEQLKAYFAANKDYFDRVEVNASHILIRVGSKATPLEKAAAKEKLQAIQQAVASGKVEFAAAARKHSQCPSAADGGRLGWLPRKGGLMDESFCKAAFVQKVGAVSEPVESERGLHLILVTERKPGTPSKYESCLEEVREAYADDRRPELIAKLRQDAAIRITLP